MRACILSALFFCCTAAKAQTRGGHYEVYAIRYASMSHRVPTSDWADQAPQQDSVQIDFMFWLIRGEGRNILVDAGFLADIEDAREFDVTRFVRPDSALFRIGLTAQEITDVILTHPHWDHIDGLGLFPQAHVWMQQEDYHYFTGGAWQKGGDHGGFAKRDVLMLTGLNVDGKLTLVDGDDREIIPGVKVYTGSRHTFNSQYVVVNTGLARIVLASDNIWVYYSLEHMKPAPPSGTYDPAGYVKAMMRMKTLASDERLIVPGHDARVFERFPRAGEGVVKIE
jgi:glyoxylase-like metal-dependent hydrolase (beta-lactamase superfamily II)